MKTAVTLSASGFAKAPIPAFRVEKPPVETVDRA